MKRLPLAALMAAFFIFLVLSVSVRQAALLLVGIGMGAALAGARFGFTTGWRHLIERRDPRGVTGQALLLALASLAALPLLERFSELHAALGPPSVSLLVGAFVFGLAMQIADGCGSGTLYKAGAGSPLSFVVLPTFAFGSFLGASHQPAWIEVGGLPAVDLLAFGWPTALAITVAACGLVAWLAGRAAHKARRGTTDDAAAPASPQALAQQLVRAGTASFVASAAPRRAARFARRWWLGALLLAVLYLLHLIVAGQPWGIVYGMGVWGAKAVAALGWDLSGDAFWGVAPHAQRLVDPILADVTSVTNIGLIYGAIAASRWSGPADFSLPSGKRLIAAAIAGLVMGYSARMAFGCNVGAYLGGIASASVHGWVWFALAFAGSIVGVRIRRRVDA